MSTIELPLNLPDPNPDALGIVDYASRREFIAMVEAAGLFTACGGDGNQASPIVVETDSRTNYGSVFAATACVDLLDRIYQTLA